MKHSNTAIAGGTARKALVLLGLLTLGAVLSQKAQAQTGQTSITNNGGNTLTSNNGWNESFNLHHTNGNAQEGGEFITHTMNLHYAGELGPAWDGMALFSLGNEMLRLTNYAAFFTDVALHGNQSLSFRTAHGESAFKMGRINSSNHFQFWNEHSADIRFGTNNLERMRLMANGKLGIGTLTPGAYLHVAPSSFSGVDLGNSATGLLVLGATSGGNLAMDDNEIMARNNGAIADLHLQAEGGALKVHDNATPGTEFVILNNGNVGIAGITAPTTALAVGGEIISYQSHSTAERDNFLGIGHGSQNGYVKWGGTGLLDFRYGSENVVASNLMRLSQGGSLLISGGTNISGATPTAALDVRGDGVFTNDLTIKGATTIGVMGSKNHLTTYGYGLFHSDDHNATTDEVMAIGHGGLNGFVRWDGDGHLDFRYGSDESINSNLMRLSQGGSLLIGGGANISNTTPGATLDVRGNATIHGMTKVKEL
ncbi:MAG TPA: hypothetical protein DCE41_31895, partial [Cytophagales bacterium]|nr:hypothetical protein [Cytophagales bacterium]HAP63131.1 hypothetical protein [Cytophagales bacterium]